MEPLFDQRLRDRRRTRGLRQSRPGADFLLRHVAADLGERLGAVSRSFAVAADIGTPGPALAEALRVGGQVGRLFRFDRPPAPGADAVGDPELLPLAPASLDLAVSGLAFHFADDLPGALAQIRAALRPDGLFLAALLGGDTLAELRTAFAAAEAELRGGASPRVIPFADVRDLGGLLQRAGFALPVADSDRLTVRYPDPIALMRDLRAMGAANPLRARERKPLRREVLLRAAEIYAERFSDPDGRVRATFEVVSLSGWAPDASQQQPLRPGSAKARLADALATVERPAGEKARG